MAARLVRSWRGVLRGQIRKCERVCSALLDHNDALAVRGITFLTPAQKTDVENTLADMGSLLEAMKPR
jgi:hypothetical protein